MSLAELEVLSIEILPPHDIITPDIAENPAMALLTALGKTTAEIGVPASQSAYVTLDRNAVDDEYGEDAGNLSRGPRSLISPNLKQLTVRIRDASASERKEIGRKCKRMVDTRRRASQEL